MARRKNSKTPAWLRVVQAKQVWFTLTCGRCFDDGHPIKCDDKNCTKCRTILMGWRIVMQNGDSYFCSKGKKARDQTQDPETRLLRPARKASGPQWSAEIGGVKESIGSNDALIERFKSSPRLLNQLTRCLRLAKSRKHQIK